MSVLLSVVIPCYNHGVYLHRSVESVLGQMTEGVEIIIVDDGSTDDSFEIARRLPPPVHLLQQKNSGPAAARNNGIAHAQGKYLVFLDADDVWLAGFADTMIQAMEKADNGTAANACGWQPLAPDASPVGRPRFIDRGLLSWEGLVLTNPFPPHAALVRVEAARSVNGFDPNFVGNADWDFWLRLVAAGYRFTVSDAILVGYRLLPNSLSRNTRSMLMENLTFLDKVFTTLAPPPSVLANREKAYALRYLDACAALYENGEDEDAANLFKQGVAIWPNLLVDTHALYTLACARQPVAYKATGHYLDLAEAETRTRDLLSSCQSSYSALLQQALGELYRVLAQLARAQRNEPLARRYISQSARLDPTRQGINSLKVWSVTWLDPIKRTRQQAHK